MNPPYPLPRYNPRRAEEGLGEKRQVKTKRCNLRVTAVEKKIFFLFLLLIEYVTVMLRKKNQIFYMAL